MQTTLLTEAFEGELPCHHVTSFSAEVVPVPTTLIPACTKMSLH